jgi:hypothetical protein
VAVEVVVHRRRGKVVRGKDERTRREEGRKEGRKEGKEGIEMKEDISFHVVHSFRLAIFLVVFFFFICDARCGSA